MKLTTKGRYGTRALLDIALNSQDGPVTLKEIARRQQIPLSYLEHLISPLVEGGVIKSARGVGGGVSLARSPGEIRLSEVIGLLENSMAPAECVDNPQICKRSEFCATRDIWRELKAAMDRVLQSRTLEDLMERQKGKG
jgi:Rrf2 family cysteine metabolism transcriptional repressor